MCINFRHYLFFILQRTNLLSHYEIINPTLELTTAAAIVANNFFERIIHITTATDKLNHTHLNYWLNIIPNSIFHMGKWHALDISSLAFVLNNVWRLAPGTQSGSPAAAAFALAVTLLVVTLYLVEQRCRGVICPSELLGSQNRIGALWKSPHHLACLLPCLQARQCLDLGLESPLSAQAFFGELHHKDNNPFNNAQGGHSQHNSRQKRNVYPIGCTLGQATWWWCGYN